MFSLLDFLLSIGSTVHAFIALFLLDFRDVFVVWVDVIIYMCIYIFDFFFFCLARGTLFSDGISLSLSFSFSFSFMTVQKWIRSGISTSATRF